MQNMVFKMERTGLLKEGDILPVKEYELANAYYYVLGKSYAMSENIDVDNRITSTEGKVIKVEETTRGFYVTVEFDGEDS